MVDSAVKTVSMQRAGLGALQNRLEYTVNNLTTTNENLTAAESQIRDTDMATEMINYSRHLRLCSLRLTSSLRLFSSYSSNLRTA